LDSGLFQPYFWLDRPSAKKKSDAFKTSDFLRKFWALGELDAQDLSMTPDFFSRFFD
jgi:hypothetical protein